MAMLCQTVLILVLAHFALSVPVKEREQEELASGGNAPEIELYPEQEVVASRTVAPELVASRGGIKLPF